MGMPCLLNFKMALYTSAVVMKDFNSKKIDATRDLDNISEAETIKDDDSVSHEGKNGYVNDDTENADVLINMEESTV